MKGPKERSRERLIHILESIERIEGYAGSINFEVFMKDAKCNDAILFQLSIIGEAIQHVDKDLLARYDYPWYVVRAQRNVIAHEYFGIRMDKIWSVVKDDLPGLKAMVQMVLDKEF